MKTAYSLFRRPFAAIAVTMGLLFAKEIADYWLSMMQIKSMKSEIIELGGNSKMIYQIGKWTITKMENGVEKNITTDVVLIWKRENNYSYKIQLNSSNNPVAYQGKAGEPFEAVQP